MFVYLSESLGPELVHQRNKLCNSHVNLRHLRATEFEPTKNTYIHKTKLKVVGVLKSSLNMYVKICLQDLKRSGCHCEVTWIFF